MRSRSSSKKGGEMEVEKLKEENQPHLSGAYIRNLVKQLSSSRIKNPMNQTPALDSVEGFGLPETIKNLSDNKNTHQPEQPQQPKKQVRRRLHTSRPYQERLLNMAEARREIVTALKFHRASMKQASEQQQQQQQQKQHQLHSQSNCLQSASPPPQEYYQTGCTNYSIPGYLENQSLLPFSCPPNIYSWSCPSIASVPIAENFNIPLPNQPLGLNLNFHDFNLDSTTLYQYNNDNPSIYSYSPQTSSSSHTEEEGHSQQVIIPMEELKQDIVSGEGMHNGVSDSDMPEIQSMENQQQMEWNDTADIVDSAWWCKFASTMEEMKEEKGDEDDGLNLFDDLMEFPDWMNANETPFLEEHLDNNSSDEYLEETSLPCMVLEGIEGMDGEWLS